MSDVSVDVAIVGAGLAGLRAALRLKDHTENILVIEEEDEVGGRVRTISKDGFLLDRGFQIFLTSYPEAQDVLNYDVLDLHPFMSGALIRGDDGFTSFIDPMRHPLKGIQSLLPGVGTLKDRWLIWQMRRELKKRPTNEIFKRPEQTTEGYLRERGFSEDIIERFFRPFFSGAFLDKTLTTSSRMFEFVYKMFSTGTATLPSSGMQEIPRQMAERLNDHQLQLNTKVTNIDGGTISCKSSRTIQAQVVLVATGAWNMNELSTDLPAEQKSRETTCLYFSMEHPPVTDPLIVINGKPEGIITNIAFPSLVAPNYGTQGKHLASVSTLEGSQEHLREQIRTELAEWFGPETKEWNHLETVRIPHSLPVREPEGKSLEEGPPRVAEGLYVAGDHRDTPSINGALASGRRAAEAILEDELL